MDVSLLLCILPNKCLQDAELVVVKLGMLPILFSKECLNGFVFATVLYGTR